MTMAVLALFADAPTTIRGIASWRVKETDRIAAMAAELRKVGAEVRESNDSITITPPATLQPATIETYKVVVPSSSNSGSSSSGTSDGWSWDVPKEKRFNSSIEYGSMIDPRDNRELKS